MARVPITVELPDKTSASLTFTAPGGAGADNGWSFSNTGDEIFVVKNTDTSTKTLTKKVVGKVGGLTPADTTVRAWYLAFRFSIDKVYRNVKTSPKFPMLY